MSTTQRTGTQREKRIADPHTARLSSIAAALSMVALAGCHALSPPASVPPCAEELTTPVRTFVQGLLTLEASGQRMRELFGRDKTQRFYASVDYDAGQEPGWDVIYVRDSFQVAKVSCVDASEDAAPDTRLVDVNVKFPAGQWFDRESTGAAIGIDHTYRVRRSGTSFKVVSRLPPPFVSVEGATGLLGARPFDTPRLLEFKDQLRKTSGAP